MQCGFDAYKLATGDDITLPEFKKCIKTYLETITLKVVTPENNYNSL